MRSLRPEQIILLLVVILVPLLDLLVRWLQQRARERRGAEAEAREERPPAPMRPRVRTIEPSLPAETPRQEGLAVGRRFARRRRRPGRAGVAMTILGPCRGLEEPPSPSSANHSVSPSAVNR